MTDDAIAQWQNTARPTWHWVWPSTVVLGALWMLAPRIELAIHPVFGVEQFTDVTRSADRLCWWRYSEKLRAPEVQNYDAFLDYASASGRRVVHEFPTIFNPTTMEPISTERAPTVGISRRHLCIALAPYIGADRPIRLRQVIHFRGFLGLWDMPVPLMTILSPPDTALPT